MENYIKLYYYFKKNYIKIVLVNLITFSISLIEVLGYKMCTNLHKMNTTISTVVYLCYSGGNRINNS